jgi:hypothetical protein
MAEKGELNRRRPQREDIELMAAGVAGQIHQRVGTNRADALPRGARGCLNHSSARKEKGQRGGWGTVLSAPGTSLRDLSR